MSHPVALDRPGERVLLMGNEAIVRGAVEAGVALASGYPGTPSSEIGDTFARVARELGIHFEWSANEKVAMEVAYGASMVGRRSMVSMKHVGLNVALDIVNLMSLRGVNAGLVFVSSDDPSQHSSGQEQDNRWLAKQNNLPVLEPSSPEEAKELVRYAYGLSERVRLPIMLRTVTRLSHMRSDVALGPIAKESQPVGFDWQGFSYRVAGFNNLFYRERELNLKLASPQPLPNKLVSKLIKAVGTVVVAEEVDPFVELHVRALAKDANPRVRVVGRMSGDLPREGELSHELLDGLLGRLLGVKPPASERPRLEEEKKGLLFDRMLTMCAGCPHRSSIYALKQAVKEVKGDLMNVVVNGDIGCYGLAHAPPMAFEDTYFCMGASLGVSQGMRRFGVDTIAWIGDGTFFHAGIPALQNAVHNGAPIKIVVADNQAVAMTGFQTNPQLGRTAMGVKVDPIMIEDIARASGVKHVEVVDPYDLEAAEEAFKRMLRAEGVAMVIARRTCAMVAVRNMRPGRPPTYAVDQDACVGCRTCLSEYGCSALVWDEDAGKASIDNTLCMGCSSCAQVCPVGAVHRRDQQ